MKPTTRFFRFNSLELAVSPFQRIYGQLRFLRKQPKPFLVKLLNNEVSKLGRQGDVVSVTRGYYRNTLFPKKQAIAVDALKSMKAHLLQGSEFSTKTKE
ncbi:putative 54S ribosomal protein L9, mitochondrial [Schizosaccharomyces pombe]